MKRTLSCSSNLVLFAEKNGVATLTLNNAKKFNGWTKPMMLALHDAMRDAAASTSTKVVVLTGSDPYYCAGVDLGGTLRPMMPKDLYETIRATNQKVFDTFIEFPKPLLVAVNGPAIGASVTSSTIADAVIASERATFSTPFSKLGVTPEGCSSVLFDRLLGPVATERMLGPEGWVPTASEAEALGLISRLVPHESLMQEAQAEAEDWIATNRPRTVGGKFRRTDELVTELLATNKKESEDLAEAFLAPKFLQAQYDFATEKGKPELARMFWALKTSRPLWSLLL